MDYPTLIAALMPAIDRAGSVILDFKSKKLTSTIKSDGSPVTLADQAAEKILLNALADLCPDIPVISEENASSHQLPASSQFFLIDPLDGTEEFLKTDNSAAFTVNIGLIENALPVMGMVYAPASDALYWGYTGGCAFMRKDTLITPIKVRKIPDSGSVALVSSSNLDDATKDWLSQHRIKKATLIGSSLKFALLASGQADVYPRFAPTMEWDTAAGDAILRAAGGMVCHPDLEAYSYGKTGYRNTPFVAYGKLSK